MAHYLQDYVQGDEGHDEQVEELEELSRIVKMEHILQHSLQ